MVCWYVQIVCWGCDVVQRHKQQQSRNRPHLSPKLTFTHELLLYTWIPRDEAHTIYLRPPTPPSSDLSERAKTRVTSTLCLYWYHFELDLNLNHTWRLISRASCACFVVLDLELAEQWRVRRDNVTVAITPKPPYSNLCFRPQPCSTGLMALFRHVLDALGRTQVVVIKTC